MLVVYLPKNDMLMPVSSVSPPGGYLNYTTSSDSSNPSASIAAPVPTNAMDGSNIYCGHWYEVCNSAL